MSNFDNNDKKYNNIEKDEERIENKESVNKEVKETTSIIKKSFGKQFKIFIVILLIIALIAGIMYTIDILFFRKVSEIINENIGGENEITKLAKTSGRTYYIDYEQSYKEMCDWCEKNSISIKNIGLTLDVWKTFLNARVATLPDLRSKADGLGTDSDEVHGKVLFYRKKADGSQILLEYKPFEQYVELAKSCKVKLENNTIGVGTGTTTEKTEDNQEDSIWNYLKSKGWSDQATAGVIGNIYIDSNYDSNKLSEKGIKDLKLKDGEEYAKNVKDLAYSQEKFENDGYGFGLMQWSNKEDKKKIYEKSVSKHISLGDMSTQLDYIIELSEKNEKMKNVIKGKDFDGKFDISEKFAAEAFYELIEKKNNNFDASKTSDTIRRDDDFDKRKDKAVEVYKTYVEEKKLSKNNNEIKDFNLINLNNGKEIKVASLFGEVYAGAYDGMSNEQRIWSKLKSRGWDDTAIAGLFGNLAVESGFRSNNMQNSDLGTADTSADESYTQQVDSGAVSRDSFVYGYGGASGGYGLIQWTSIGRKEYMYDYIKGQGKSIADEDAQLDVIEYELANVLGMPNFKNGISDKTGQKFTSVGEAVDMFFAGSERQNPDFSFSAGEEAANNLPGRRASGEEYYKSLYGTAGISSNSMSQQDYDKGLDTYISKEDFEKNYSNMEDSYTINSNGDIVVSNYTNTVVEVINSGFASEEETINKFDSVDEKGSDFKSDNSNNGLKDTYEINTSEINYRSQVTDATQPIETYLAFLVATKNEAFAKELATTDYDKSKTVFEIDGDLTTVITTEKELMNLDFKGRKEIGYNDPEGVPTTEDEDTTEKDIAQNVFTEAQPYRTIITTVSTEVPTVNISQKTTMVSSTENQYTLTQSVQFGDGSTEVDGEEHGTVESPYSNPKSEGNFDTNWDDGLSKKSDSDNNGSGDSSSGFESIFWEMSGNFPGGAWSTSPESKHFNAKDYHSYLEGITQNNYEGKKNYYYQELLKQKLYNAELNVTQETRITHFRQTNSTTTDTPEIPLGTIAYDPETDSFNTKDLTKNIAKFYKDNEGDGKTNVSNLIKSNFYELNQMLKENSNTEGSSRTLNSLANIYNGGGSGGSGGSGGGGSGRSGNSGNSGNSDDSNNNDGDSNSGSDSRNNDNPTYNSSGENENEDEKVTIDWELTNKLAKAAYKYVKSGLKYQENGDNLKSGVNNPQFVYQLLKTETKMYDGEFVALKNYRTKLEKYLVGNDISKAQEGDVIVYKRASGAEGYKVCVYAGRDNIIMEVSKPDGANAKKLNLTTYTVDGIYRFNEDGSEPDYDPTLIRLIMIEPISLKLKPKETAQLKATIIPSELSSKAKITWKSSDKNKATVDQNGKVTAIKQGTVTITAETSGKKATCSVKISGDFVAYGMNGCIRVGAKSVANATSYKILTVDYNGNKNIATIPETQNHHDYDRFFYKDPDMLYWDIKKLTDNYTQMNTWMNKNERLYKVQVFAYNGSNEIAKSEVMEVMPFNVEKDSPETDVDLPSLNLAANPEGGTEGVSLTINDNKVQNIYTKRFVISKVYEKDSKVSIEWENKMNKFTPSGYIVRYKYNNENSKFVELDFDADQKKCTINNLTNEKEYLLQVIATGTIDGKDVNMLAEEIVVPHTKNTRKSMLSYINAHRGDPFSGNYSTTEYFTKAQAEAYANHGFGSNNEAFPSATNYFLWANMYQLRLYIFRKDQSDEWRLWKDVAIGIASWSKIYKPIGKYDIKGRSWTDPDGIPIRLLVNYENESFGNVFHSVGIGGEHTKMINSERFRTAGCTTVDIPWLKWIYDYGMRSTILNDFGQST